MGNIKKVDFTNDAAVEVLNSMGEFIGDDLDRFDDPTFEVSKSSYTTNLGSAMVLFENMIDNYGQVCIDDVKLAARYLLIVIAARWRNVNFRKAKKELGIDALMRKYPWK